MPASRQLWPAAVIAGCAEVSQDACIRAWADRRPPTTRHPMGRPDPMLRSFGLVAAFMCEDLRVRHRSS